MAKGNKGKGTRNGGTDIQLLDKVEISKVDQDIESALMSGTIQSESLSKAQAELQRASDWIFETAGFDKLLVDGRNLRFVINTESESRIRLNCKGYFRFDAFEDAKDGEIIGVINIVPELWQPDYDDKPLKIRLMTTIHHEMCHATNSANGIVDCTKNAHNGNFKNMATLAGSDVTKGTKSQGWALTTLNEQLVNIVNHGFEFDETAFEIFARDTKGKGKTTKGKRAAQVRWECPECHKGFRTSSTSAFNIACMDCSTIDDSGKALGNIDQLIMFELQN